MKPDAPGRRFARYRSLLLRPVRAARAALAERKGMLVRVIGGPEKKPRVRRRSEAKAPRKGVLPD